MPNIKWVKDGMTVGTEDMLTFETNRNDSGKYLCTAENGLDVPINASAQLNVQCKQTCLNRNFTLLINNKVTKNELKMFTLLFIRMISFPLRGQPGQFQGTQSALGPH